MDSVALTRNMSAWTGVFRRGHEDVGGAVHPDEMVMHFFDAVDRPHYREHDFTVVFAWDGAANFHLAILDREIDQSVGNPTLGVELSADRSADLPVRRRFVRLRGGHQDVSQYAVKGSQHRQINVIHTKNPSYRPGDLRIQPHVRHFATPMPHASRCGAPQGGALNAGVGAYQNYENPCPDLGQSRTMAAATRQPLEKGAACDP